MAKSDFWENCEPRFSAIGWLLAGFEITVQGSGLVHCELWQFFFLVNASEVSLNEWVKLVCVCWLGWLLGYVGLWHDSKKSKPALWLLCGRAVFGAFVFGQKDRNARQGKSMVFSIWVKFLVCYVLAATATPWQKNKWKNTLLLDVAFCGFELWQLFWNASVKCFVCNLGCC